MDRLLGRYAVSRYHSEQELRSKLRTDIAGWLEPRPADVPGYPPPRFVHPIPVPKPFVGRDEELERLRRWFNAKTRVLAITGVAGIGKSALVARWLAELTPAPQGAVFVATAREPVDLPSRTHT